MPNPQQGNGSDCGIFVLIFAMELANGRDPPRTGYVVSSEDVALMRHNIAICLGHYDLSHLLGSSNSLSVPVSDTSLPPCPSLHPTISNISLTPFAALNPATWNDDVEYTGSEDSLSPSLRVIDLLKRVPVQGTIGPIWQPPEVPSPINIYLPFYDPSIHYIPSIGKWGLWKLEKDLYSILVRTGINVAVHVNVIDMLSTHFSD